MKLNRKLVLILALVLSLALVSGSTLAYLTDTDKDVNVMTLGNVKIEQLEYERIDTETVGDDALVQGFNDNKPLYPAVYDSEDVWQPGITENDAIITWDQLGNNGSWNGIWDPSEIENEVDKFVFAKNIGKSDAYVRTWFAFELGTLTMDEWWDMVHLNINNTHWSWPESLAGYTEMEIDDVRYAVCCVEYTRNNGILAPGELSRPSLLQVALDKAATNETVEGFGDTYEILVVTQAVQTAGFNNASTALNEGFGAAIPANAPFAGMVAAEEAEKEYESTHPVEHAGIRYATLQEGVDAAAAAGGGTVLLHADLQQSGTVAIPANLDITIDGNGHKLSRAEGFTDTILTVGGGATLATTDVVMDGGAVWSGDTDTTLKRGNTNTGVVATGSLIAVAGNNAQIVLNSGTILQNNAGAYAVNLGTRIGATLTLNNAQIINNASGAGAIWGGGHITVNDGSRISYNSSTSLAGAIRMVSSCNLTMNGGEISNNYAAGDGGAIWGYGSSTYNLKGGKMSGNKADGVGGAIYTGTYSVLNLSGDFELSGNQATDSGAIRLTDHTSLNMTGGTVKGNTQNGESNAFNTWNNTISITGGAIDDNFSYVGGLGLTIGAADIDGVISYNLATGHKTAYLAADFNGFSFRVNADSAHFANFNFKPEAGYTYTNGDESKLVCLNDGYVTYWDAATGTFRLKAE